MSRFLQLHVLTSYPPSNLNRDDTGRPKSAIIGNVTRLRISSQSLKRAWRTSDVFVEQLGADKTDALGTRTKLKGKEVYADLIKQGVAEKDARTWAKSIAGEFGKLKSDKKTEDNEDLEIEQLVHFSPEELRTINELVVVLAARKSAPTENELKLLSKPREAADIAMFGRMLAKHPAYNCEAAVQVAHAFTVHPSANESDYFTAVDDLNAGHEDRGAAHIGEVGFGAGVFYLYVCIDKTLLLKNLGEDLDSIKAKELSQRALAALVHGITQVSPTGKQNSFASRAYASYVLAESGDQQPRSLSQAFVKPIKRSDDVIGEAISRLETLAGSFDAIYGTQNTTVALSVDSASKHQTVSLNELIYFIQQ